MTLRIQILFFLNNTATTEIYTLSLHNPLPISARLDPREPLLRASQHGPDALRALSPLRVPPAGGAVLHHRDRKSTRLNSSHANISYAVFCLKKKKTVTTMLSISCSSISTYRLI